MIVYVMLRVYFELYLRNIVFKSKFTFGKNLIFKFLSIITAHNKDEQYKIENKDTDLM
jgi:hypothetical protein